MGEDQRPHGSARDRRRLSGHGVLAGTRRVLRKHTVSAVLRSRDRQRPQQVPKSLQLAVKANLREIWQAETRTA